MFFLPPLPFSLHHILRMLKTEVPQILALGDFLLRVYSSTPLSRVLLSQVLVTSKNIIWNIPEQFMNFKLCAILSGVMKCCVIPFILPKT